jgi:hypothetical protein
MSNALKLAYSNVKIKKCLGVVPPDPHLKGRRGKRGEEKGGFVLVSIIRH